MNIVATTGVSMCLFAIGFFVGSKNFSDALNNFPQNRDSNRLGKLLVANFLIAGIQNLIIGFGSLIHYGSGLEVKIIFIVSNLLLGIHSILGTYLFYEIFFPKKSKILQLSIILFICVLSILLCIVLPMKSVPRFGGGDLSFPLIVALLTFLMILFSATSVIAVFFKIYSTSQIVKTRYFSLALAVLLSFALLSAFLRVVVYRSEGVPLFVNVLFSALGISLAVVFLGAPLISKISMFLRREYK